MTYERARELRREETEAERRLWSRLRNRQVGNAKFRRQQPIGDYFADFVCMRFKLVVEVDGGQHAERPEYDAMRTAYMEDRGFRVLRFWNNEVLGDIDAVLDSILRAVEQRRP